MTLQVILILCLFGCISSRPVVKNDQNKVDVNKYLMKYGYLSDSMKEHSDDDVREALAYFQKFVGLDPTGVADDGTLNVMQKPRCGMKDVDRDGGRQKRFVHKGGKWRKRSLVYGIYKNNYPRRITQGSTNGVLRESFQLWDDVSGLEFRMGNRAERQSILSLDIGIRFATGNHGDGSPFDGPWGVMAHAFFPNYGGSIHFDDDEYWTAGRGEVSFKQIAVHEIGHSLGLGHSDVRAAVMAPVYMGYNPNFRLHADDIRGVQQLYGAPENADQDQDGNGGPRGDRGNITAHHRFAQPVNIRSSLDVLGVMQDSAGVLLRPDLGHMLAVFMIAVVCSIDLAL